MAFYKNIYIDKFHISFYSGFSELGFLNEYRELPGSAFFDIDFNLSIWLCTESGYNAPPN